MRKRSALCSALLLAFTTCAWSADKAPPKKASKAAPKTAAKPATPKPVKAASIKAVNKAAANSATSAVTARALASTRPAIVKTTLAPPAVAAPAVLKGPREVLTCRDGTEDRHARIAVVLVGGKAESFAYYSKWKPRTCSIYLQRNRDASRWSDSGSVTNVAADRGLFMIEHGKGEYRFVFRDVDRERYCGMDGKINGTLTIRKGSEQCEVAGIMEEGVPLGQAVAYAEAAAAAASATATHSAAPGTTMAPPASAARAESSFFKRVAERLHHDPAPTWNGGVIVGD